MTPTWQRARQPDDVPTPIAVAVSDFCRRAKAPASAPEVREALAALDESEDFRVRELTDHEPEAQPLGPFAVVDVLRGTAPALAAQRQSCGYYALVRELLQLVEEKTVRVIQEAPPAPAPVHTGAAAPRSTKKPQRGQEEAPEEVPMDQRIAPRKRSSEERIAAAAAEERTLAPETPIKDRALPRGRFTRLDVQRADIGELETSRDAAEQVSTMIDQHPHRYSLHKALAAHYTGERGSPLTEEELVRVIRTLGLEPKLVDRERERLLGSVSDQKGALGRAAWNLGLSPSEFHRLVQALGLRQEVDELRERFRREALGSRHLGARLDLLGREKYLGDLGIKKRFIDSLRGELEELLRGSGDTLEERIDRVARDQGVAAELLTRAVDRLGLSGPAPHASPT